MTEKIESGSGNVFADLGFDRPDEERRLARMAIDELEKFLLSLLNNKFSSLTISFNDATGPNYETVESWLIDGALREDHDFVSDEEKQKAIATNSLWEIQWYPNSPNGFNRVSASSLEACVRHIIEAS